jgi:hypothetical protein
LSFNSGRQDNSLVHEIYAPSSAISSSQISDIRPASHSGFLTLEAPRINNCPFGQ